MNLNHLGITCCPCSAISMLFMSAIHLRTAVSGSDSVIRKGLISSFLTKEEVQHVLTSLECLHDATQGAL